MTGGIIVVVGVVVMVMMHEAGHFIAAKSFGMKATEFFFGFGPKLWSVQRGETEYGIKALPFGGYVRIIGMNPFEEVAAEDEPRTYRGARFWKKSLVVLAGVGANFAIAFILLWVVAAVIGEPDFDQPNTRVASVIAETDDGAPTAASLAGIREGDRIVEVNGTSITLWDDLTNELGDRPNEEVDLVLERDGELVSLNATLTARLDEDTGQVRGFLGVGPSYETQRDNPLSGLGTAASRTGTLTQESAKGLWALVTGLGDLVAGVFGSGDVSDQVRPLSPIGIARLGAESERIGLDLTITIVAWINIFVGLLNVLPIYPLDGGHFAVALYQKATGREPDVRKLVPIAAAVVLFIVFLGIIGVYLDIFDPVDLS